MPPLPNDVQRISSEVANLASSSDQYSGNKTAAARRIIRHTYHLPKVAADGAAATATLYTASPGFRPATAGRILAAYFLPQAAAVADAANNATVSINKSDGLGGAATVMASAVTDIAGGSLAAGVNKTLTNGTEANRRYTAGQLISLAISKAGTGVVIPAGTFQIDIEEESADAYGAG